MAVLSPSVLVEQSRSRVGQSVVRSSTDTDAVDGIHPSLVVEPLTTDDMVATLAWASTERLKVMVVGGRTKQGWGAPATSIDLMLSTARLNRVVEHCHGDLTATVEAGATLASVNRELARHRQWLPWDPPWSDRATIGGIVATNDTGPRRHGYGAPRDGIIGVAMVRADGELAKSGGIVVKNVAGYDVSRLVTGSFGCLGVIVTATFKVLPIVGASRTVAIELDTLESAESVVRSLSMSALTPTAIELVTATDQSRLLVRFESVEEASVQQSQQACSLVGSFGQTKILTGEDEAILWREHAMHWSEEADATLIKLSCAPAELFEMLKLLRTASAEHGLECAAAGRAGLGVVDVRLDGSIGAQVRMIQHLRQQLTIGRGSVVVRNGSVALRRKIDTWGEIGSGLRVMKAVKSRFDPDNRLSPGRGPGGL
ncbi:MAG: FAD-binding oxidoreductase [Vicinamibacterales bacterium]